MRGNYKQSLKFWLLPHSWSHVNSIWVLGNKFTLKWLRCSTVMWLPFLTYPADFPQAKSVGKPAGKVASHSVLSSPPPYALCPPFLGPPYACMHVPAAPRPPTCLWPALSIPGAPSSPAEPHVPFLDTFCLLTSVSWNYNSNQDYLDCHY